MLRRSLCTLLPAVVLPAIASAQSARIPDYHHWIGAETVESRIGDYEFVGGLITWQTSFAGDDDRAEQDSLTVQPFFIYNLPKGWYARSSATMIWDFERNTHVTPIGAGLGKVFVRANGTSINVFAEPQSTVDHKGIDQPKFQVFAGVNLQFPIGN